MFKWLRKKEYRISVDREDWVAPEETLADSLSDHTAMEAPISGNVFKIMAILVLTAFFVICATVIKMAIFDHEYYFQQAYKNKTVNFAVAPPRGLIVDRRGTSLVSNIASFDLLAVSRELPKKDPERADTIVGLSNILAVTPDELSDKISEGSSKNAVFFAANDLTKDQVLAVKNLDPKGYYVITGTKRNYIDGRQFSNIIGYVGRVAKDDLVADDYYLPSDIIGRNGIEYAYEEDLRGAHGKITFSRKDLGGESLQATPGNTVVLNVDFEAQKKLYSILFNVLRESNLSGGAAIVQNPQNGEIIAMASFPDYDNNIFNDSVSQAEYERLFESKSKPLFNRVIGGLYNPGSTIKPFMGLIGLEEKVIDPKFTIQDCVKLVVPNPFDKDKPYEFDNWRADLGLFNLKRAIANSCNIYFFTLGGGYGNFTGLGVNRIVDYLGRAFADKVLGIDIAGEQGGFLPTPDWKKKTRGEPWYQGDTYNISIGQGDLLITPIWLNAYVSAIANGGKIYRPRLASKIIDDNNNTIRNIDQELVVTLPFSSANIEEMQTDMRETVLSGTSQILKDLPVPAAAKTGTAEVIKGKTINAIFVAYAPTDNPQIAITVLVEGSASNQGYATRTANDFMKWYFTRSRPEAVIKPSASPIPSVNNPQ